MSDLDRLTALRQRDLLEMALKAVGADTVRHGDRWLINHLLGTFDLLDGLACPADVCAAGGLHSIFGTNSFRHQTVSAQARATLARLFSERAARLAFIFGHCARPWCLDPEKEAETLAGEPVTAQDYMDLRLIEAANLIEQGAKVPDFILAAYVERAKPYRNEANAPAHSSVSRSG